MAATAGGAPPSLPANNVLTSAQWVMSGASHVTINTQGALALLRGGKVVMCAAARHSPLHTAG
jgi:hypothetical protein